MKTFTSSAPFRRVCGWIRLLGIIARLPWWVLSNLLPGQRPLRSWSLRRAVMVHATRAFVKGICRTTGNSDMGVTIPSHSKLEVGNGVQGVYVDPASSLIVGKVKEWAEKAGVEPVRIPGYWIHKEGVDSIIGQEPVGEEKVVYFLHGGGYTMFSAHPNDPTSAIPHKILEYCPSVKRTFAIEYRLSSVALEPVAGQFPSALIDSISGYNYLVNELGYSSSQIIVVGDSAGGNLALALTRYLTEHKGSAPRFPEVPGALILLSPWADMSASHSSPESSCFSNRCSDLISLFDEPYGANAPPSFIEPFGNDFTCQTPYISPASKYLDNVSFDGFPRAFITVGDAEILLDEIRELSRRMKNGMGDNKVVYYEAKSMFHDHLCFEFAEPERSETLTAISSFVEGSTR